MFKISGSVEKLKYLSRYFKKDEAFCASDNENLNIFMKRKQAIFGFLVFVMMLLIIYVLHGLAAKSPQVRETSSASQESFPDGVLSTDFSEKDSLSALEVQQKQIDALSENMNDLKKLTASLEEQEKEREKVGFQENLKIPESPSGLAHVPVAQMDQIDDKLSDTHPMETLSFNYKTTGNREHHNYRRDVEITRNKSRNIKTWVPAGTFVRGVLLEGADANASVNGQSDTVPILVRLLDQGTLPNGSISKLRGCFVLASIYGDISSERGEARLNTLSCTRKDGSILEVPVQGHLSFAGKEGIKGKPIMRNGKILAMAGMSGTLSGIGGALQQTTQTISTNPAGSLTTVNGSQIWENGAYGGATTAMGQLAHYYIQRANQYHPIISIGSGTVATVIFQSGFSLVDEVEKPSEPFQADSHEINTSNNETEIKSLLAATKKDNQDTSSAPFSDVSQLQMGQGIENE